MARGSKKGKQPEGEMETEEGSAEDEPNSKKPSKYQKRKAKQEAFGSIQCQEPSCDTKSWFTTLNSLARHVESKHAEATICPKNGCHMVFLVQNEATIHQNDSAHPKTQPPSHFLKKKNK